MTRWEVRLTPMFISIFKGSLAYTGKGHAADNAVALGLNDYSPADLVNKDVDKLLERNWENKFILINKKQKVKFSPDSDIIFNKGESLPEHPNGMIFELVDQSGEIILSETYFSIGGGFIKTLAEFHQLKKTNSSQSAVEYPYPFNSADSMLEMAVDSGLSISDMKRSNENINISDDELNRELDVIWLAMQNCVKNGLSSKGILPGKIRLSRRAKALYDQFQDSPEIADVNDWLCAYAMAVSEENAMGHTVVTAPTNGAAGVIPAVLYYFVTKENGTIKQVPCIERNCFSAIKAYTAASLAMRGNGQHFMSLDNCIAAMKQTGLEMSEKYKETSLGGLAVSIIEC